MNNSRLSPIISLLIVFLSSVIIDTHARYHHTEVLPRRHRHRHYSPSSSSLNSVSHRHNANSQHEGKKSPPLYEDTPAYEELYEDSDYPEDYESLEEDYNYEDYEVRPRRRRFRDHPRFTNYRGSRLNRRRFFVRERNFEPDYYDEDYNYNYNHNHNHNHNRNRNFKEELEIPRRHRKDFVKRRPSFGPRKGYAVKRQTGRKIPDYDSEEEFEFEREHKKKHNLTGNNNNNNVNFVHEKDKEVDKEEEDKEEEDIWKEADEADDEEEEDDEEEKSFDDKDFMKMEDNNYFYKGAKREYRNIDVNGSRGVVRKEVRSVSSSEEFRREKGFENSSFREKPMKIRVRDEDYDRRNLQSDNGEEPEEEEETSAPITISAPKSTTMMSTAAVSTTALTSASRPVITGQTYERRDSRFSDPTSSSSSPTSHGTHKVPVKDIKSLPGNNANKSGKSAEIREALQHAMKVSREGSCQWPRARVIPVRDVYPSPSTTYIPHCAILHRCSDDTGCCRSESLTCVPKQFHKVELYFYTTSIGGGSVVEKLSFYNHTECECREKTEYGMQNDNKVQESNEFKSHVSSGRQHQSLVPQNIRKPVTKKPCRCPSEFTPRMNFDGECVCDCFENDQYCFRARRGKGYFSYRDRLCIQNEECAVPSCEFGDYIKRQGRCPRKKEKFDEIASYPNHMNYHNRHRS